jgi:membrane-bound lytic murein transglycosylase A
VEGGLLPYYSRAEIDAGALSGRGLEIAWVNDPIELFFLQVQGQGRLRMQDGTVLQVGVAGDNGHPYSSIGRLLVSQGAIADADMSAQAVQTWLVTHADQARTVMETNARYVFFNRVAGTDPVGTQGVALTPGRSLAVDNFLLPLGAPMWLDIGGVRDGEPRLQRLVVAQDTGAAIRGGVRGDLYWGSGPQAEATAGLMRSTGVYYVLLPKIVADREQAAE